MTPAEELEAAALALRQSMEDRHAAAVSTVAALIRARGDVAELLDYQARYAALYDSLAGRPATDPHPDAQTRHALAVARAILGQES